MNDHSMFNIVRYKEYPRVAYPVTPRIFDEIRRFSAAMLDAVGPMQLYICPSL